ncbi:MAG: glutaminyl-peptide cyclotransferase [Actinomycetota bacterium]
MQARRLMCAVLVALVAGACGSDDTASSSDDVLDVFGADPPAVTQPATTAADDDESTTTAQPASRWPRPLDELDPAEPARWGLEVLDRRPHDTGAFTQGLEQLADGTLLESTGERGASTIRVVDPDSGSVLASASLTDEEFGEGATVVDDTIIQLTWQEQRARRWRLDDLARLSSWEYQGEGWGLCLLDDRLVMSDGSATLTFRDPTDFSVLERVTVTFEGDEVTRLNELECVDGHVIANVWQSATVVVIRPDGAAVAAIDGSPLTAEIASASPGREVLNGIAVRDETSLWMTGKLWPTLFAVRVVPRA